MTRTFWFLPWILVIPVQGALLRKKQRAETQVEGETQLWRPCGVENQPINEDGLVRFGFGLTWVEREVPRGASCSIMSFGSDPAPGIMKMCECAGGAPPSLGSYRRVTDDMGLTWFRCADEGQDCKCDSGIVRFGSAARWVAAEEGAKKGQKMSCAVPAFGGKDPAIAQQKECWCQMPPANGVKPANPSVAIVLLSRRAPDLKSWLQYHLGYMGVQHVFMDVEDSPHFDELYQSLSPAQRQRLTVWKSDHIGTGSDVRPQDDYTTLQARQLQAMRRAKAESKQLGIEWLIHIDDDELLYAPLHHSIGEILASVPQGYDQAYIPNVEAIYNSPDVKKCFVETNVVNMNRYTFVSYANGKAAVRVSNDDAQPAGPHQWRTSQGLEVSSIHLDAETFGSPLWLVHFESCPFDRWEDKFWELGNTSPDKVQGIPFEFYKQSITRMQHCRKRSQAGASFLEEGNHDCSENALKELWSHWKTRANTAIRPEDLMPITIPWDKVQAMNF